MCITGTETKEELRGELGPIKQLKELLEELRLKRRKWVGVMRCVYL